MREEKKTFRIVLVVLGVLILTGFAFFKLYQVNEKNKQSLPYLTLGESIETFDLLDENATQIKASTFKADRPALIFIFSRPCSPCEKNLVYWRKMREVLKDSVDFYGIILGDPTTAFNSMENTKLDFKLFIPADLDKFIQIMRIKLNLSQTILYAQNQVKYLKLGNLEGEDAVNIINMAKTLIKI
ncbi:MAG: redoxin domain-containing protein [Acidobacteria bacterium]|jgi:peroxiredoxin|nr:redoxin domain-containing protein [Acidobacteriota bacterium]